MATMSYNPLRMHPPDGAGSGRNSQQLYMADPTSFVVRTLQPITNSLEGAFRVHLTQDSLSALGLNTGDLCLITTGSTTGLGIAWRATDKMGNSPKHRPAKMTETLRGAFGISDGAQVTIGRAKTGTKILLAERVVLTDVTPSDSGYATGLEDDKWLGRATTTLHECEAVALGTTFDVKSKRQLKKRFFVDHIEGAGAVGPALFTCNDHTKITISDGSQAAEIVSTSGGANTQSPLLEMSKIGGLVAQVQELNRHLDDVLRRSREEAYRSQESRHVLLHGYEGTGKSMLLKRTRQSAQGSGCRVFDLKLDGTTVKQQSQMSDMFRDARAAAPSIVLVDNIERKFSKDQTIMVDALADELDKLAGTNVVVVAATRSISDVHSELMDRGRLDLQIELPIPDTAARKAILVVLLSELTAADRDTLADAVAQKTHGFTGRDLNNLTGKAYYIAKHRDHDDWIQVGARASVLHGTPDGQMDGSVHSQATTEVEHATQTLANLAIDHDRLPTIEDFAQALLKARPSALRELVFEKPKTRWSDIGGSEAAKQRFDDAIGIPLHHADILAEHRARPSTGVLLYGPPGCSKTMTAQAVAATYDLNFIAVKGAELISMYVGESERAVRDIFRKAAQAAPCMIFFDEIDAIGSERESGGGTKGLNVLTTLLTEMDGFNAREGVYVLAATNKPDSLDPALLRPGRFDSLVYVGLPTAEARHEILNIALRGQPVPVAAAEITRLVSETEGYSGAEVVGVCQVAKMATVKRRIRGGNVAMAREDFEEGFKQVTKGVTVKMLVGYEAFASRGANK
ncbi:AAA+-type ATPase [Elasticomyces elasticus]|nr:AAA+-type ATPase [Elasticomyces elasticus]